MHIVDCPHLGARVELTDERQQHILSKHPELLPTHFGLITETVADPDEVRRDQRFPATRIFSRWYPNVERGKHIVVVIVTDAEPNERHWIVSAYMTRRVRQGVTEWKRT
jgi:hypothetical protein